MNYSVEIAESSVHSYRTWCNENIGTEGELWAVSHDWSVERNGMFTVIYRQLQFKNFHDYVQFVLTWIS
jgi:hypothetical protein